MAGFKKGRYPYNYSGPLAEEELQTDLQLEAWILDTRKEQNWDAYLDGKLVKIDHGSSFENKARFMKQFKKSRWLGYLRKHSEPISDWDAYQLNRKQEKARQARIRFHNAVKKGDCIKRYSDIVAGR